MLKNLVVIEHHIERTKYYLSAACSQSRFFVFFLTAILRWNKTSRADIYYDQE
jgi:hypothetical protein